MPVTSPAQTPIVPGQAPPDRRRERLLSYSAKNMIYSMLAVVALAFGLWALIPGEDAVQRRPAELDPVAEYVVGQVGHPIYVPQGLPAGWTATTARLTEIGGQPTWRLGVVTPEGEFAALSQTLEATETWTATVLAGTAELGEQAISGPAGSQSWQVHVGSGEIALLLPPHEGQPATSVVHGSASEAEVVEFIGHLAVVEP